MSIRADLAHQSSFKDMASVLLPHLHARYGATEVQIAMLNYTNDLAANPTAPTNGILRGLKGRPGWWVDLSVTAPYLRADADLIKHDLTAAGLIVWYTTIWCMEYGDFWCALAEEDFTQLAVMRRLTNADSPA